MGLVWLLSSVSAMFGRLSEGSGSLIPERLSQQHSMRVRICRLPPSDEIVDMRLVAVFSTALQQLNQAIYNLYFQHQPFIMDKRCCGMMHGKFQSAGWSDFFNDIVIVYQVTAVR